MRESGLRLIANLSRKLVPSALCEKKRVTKLHHFHQLLHKTGQQAPYLLDTFGEFEGLREMHKGGWHTANLIEHIERVLKVLVTSHQ